MGKIDKNILGLIILACLIVLFAIIFVIVRINYLTHIPDGIFSGILRLSFIAIIGILLCTLFKSMNTKYKSFVQTNLAVLITTTVAFVFLLIRLAFPDYVRSDTADVLLLLFVPLLVLIFMIHYKLKEQKKDIENLKSDFFETIGFKVISFESKEKCDNYYKNNLRSSKIIKDLTWAEVLPTEYTENPDNYYIDLIKGKQEYQEIFIFSINGAFRQDRLLKLKTIYEHIKDSSKEHLNYSCSYYDETTFERLQYTIFDEKEVLFTSSYYSRCTIEGVALFNILSKYFDQAWEESKKLIEHGQIVDKEKIEELISKLAVS